jgi:glycosyltransferase involved in cell wall biosynthesis
MHPLARKILKPVYARCSPAIQARLRSLYAVLIQGKMNRRLVSNLLFNKSIVPEWIADELKSIARIEPALYPTPEFLAQFHHYQTPVQNIPGEVYIRLHSLCGKDSFDAVLFAPWLVRGGADKGTLQYLRYYTERGFRVLLILTEMERSPWLHLVPPEVTVIEARSMLNDLWPDDRKLVLTRLLLQYAPPLIHVVNSNLGWSILRDHYRSLKACGCRLIGSFFCDDYDSLGRPYSYAQSFLPAIGLLIDRAITDSSYYCDDLAKRFGLDRKKLAVVHFWADRQAIALESSSLVSRRILWAGRLCPQKCPDILIAIAEAMPDVTFVVHGEVDSRSAPLLPKLKALSNVEWHGEFNSFSKIAAMSRCDGFLYTSFYDGLPNILLEAVAAGLPIIAPDVGGIGDFCKPTTGWLIASPEDLSGYVAAVRDLLSNRAEALRRWQQAWNLLEQNHSKRAFDEAMDGMIAGLGIAPSVQEREAIQLTQNRA